MSETRERLLQERAEAYDAAEKSYQALEKEGRPQFREVWNIMASLVETYRRLDAEIERLDQRSRNDAAADALGAADFPGGGLIG